MSHRRAGAEATAAKGGCARSAGCWPDVCASWPSLPCSCSGRSRRYGWSRKSGVQPDARHPAFDRSLRAAAIGSRRPPAREERLIGALIVIIFYILVGGRVYCAWVCPLNLVTDLAGWLRYRLGIKGSVHVARSSRYGVLMMTLLLSALTGTSYGNWSTRYRCCSVG